ncbi:MAG: helix-turn-helix transcriptional regulator [Myxococcales bacterium]|nr:helix-turn-helix transcriptional regulator [Myxococcales bacterium]
MQTADLSTVFAALADPTRRAIVARLSEGDAAVKELAEPFALSGPAITKHLKVLERAGLISRSREGKLRPCRLEASALAPAADWIDQYRAMWEAQLDRLGELLARTAPRSPPSATNAEGASEAPSSRAKSSAARVRTATTSKKRGRRHGRTK